MNVKIIVRERKEYKQKYITQVFSFTIMAAINQPKWLMDEKAIIFRKDVWFKPLKDPIIMEVIIIPAIK